MAKILSATTEQLLASVIDQSNPEVPVLRSTAVIQGNVTINTPPAVEITNDAGAPIPVNSASIEGKLDQVIANTQDLDINTDQVEAKLDEVKAAIQALPGGGGGPSTVTGSTNKFYSDQTVTALTGAYQNMAFGFDSLNITLFCDGTTVIEFSFDGAAKHGELRQNEKLAMDYRRQPGIWLKGAGASYRLMAY